MPKKARGKNQYISNNLRIVREFSKITQKQLAEHLKISRTTYVKWESDIAQPSYEDLRKILEFYHEKNINVNFDMMLSGKIYIDIYRIKSGFSIYMQVGQRIRQLRIQKGVSQQVIADYLGINRSTYNNYEMGKSTMTYITILMLADFYSVDFNTLLCYDIQKKKKTKDIPCMPKDTVYVIDCTDKELNEYVIVELTIYAVIVKENEILLTCNGSGHYQWTLNEDAFLNLEDAQQKLNYLKANN